MIAHRNINSYVKHFGELHAVGLQRDAPSHITHPLQAFGPAPAISQSCPHLNAAAVSHSFMRIEFFFVSHVNSSSSTHTLGARVAKLLVTST
jgi:hypothetical protein